MAAYVMENIGTAMPYAGMNRGIVKIRVDVPAEIARLGISAFGAADVLRLFTAPAGMIVEWAGVKPVTAEGATCTGDLGFTGTAAGFLDDADLNTTTPTANAATFVPKIFASATHIIWTFNTASTDAAVFDVILGVAQV